MNFIHVSVTHFNMLICCFKFIINQFEIVYRILLLGILNAIFLLVCEYDDCDSITIVHALYSGNAISKTLTMLYYINL